MTAPAKVAGRTQQLALYASVLVTASWVAHIGLRGMYGPGHPLRVLATVVLSAAVGLLVIAVIGAIRRLDEMQQQIQLLALAVAFPASLVAAFALGFLRSEGFFQHLDARDLPSVMVFLYAMGYIVARRRYR